MDLIDRDAAHDAIGFERCDRSCTDCPTKCTWFFTIKNIPAVNRWISVEDALPEQSGVYLAYFTFKDGTHATDIAYINTGCHLGSITHWMPLPEPPKE